jgi:hypothetical protein
MPAVSPESREIGYARWNKAVGLTLGWTNELRAALPA